MDSAILIIKISDDTDFDKIKLSENVRELRVLWSDGVKEYNKSNKLYSVKHFLYKVCQNHRNLRILDLSQLEGLSEAYYDIWWITEIYLPSTVKRVHYSPARSLRKISALGAEEISVNNAPNLDCVISGNSLQKINLSNTGIAKIEIPLGCKFEYAGAFRKCKNLREIDVSKSIDLPPLTFENCENLSKIVLPDHITKLEHGVFKGCRNLIEIDGGLSINEIAKDAFEGCRKLETIAPWNIFKKLAPKEQFELSQECFGDGVVEHIGIVLSEFYHKWIVWSFNKQRYYLTDFFCFKEGELLEVNDIVKFKTEENPHMMIESKVYLFRNSSCLKFTDFEVLKVPYETESLSIAKQKLLFEYFKPEEEIKQEYDIFNNELLERISKVNITEIVNAYSVKARTWWQIRPGKDDFECTEYKTTSIYSDEYIETLLPLRNYKSHSNGICPLGYYDEDEENKKLQSQVDYETKQYKENALALYSKENHINYFTDKFWSERKKIQDEANRTFHIEMLKDFVRPLHKLYGHQEDVYGILLNCDYCDVLEKDNILEGPFYRHL